MVLVQCRPSRTARRQYPRILSLPRTPRLRKSLSKACVQNEVIDCPKWFCCSAVRVGRCCPAQSRKTWVLWGALSKMTKARKVVKPFCSTTLQNIGVFGCPEWVYCPGRQYPGIPSLLRTPGLRKSLSKACVQNEGDGCPKWFCCSAVRPGRSCPK